MGNRSRLERLFGPRGREWSITLHLLANPLSVAGLAMITGILFCVILAPWMTVYNLNAINVDASFSPPSLEHIFGTDSLGRDIFTRILFGGQFTLLIGLSIVIVGGSVGSIVGMTTGYFGGYFDNLIMRIADIVLAFPPIILAIAISGALGPGIVSVVSALTFTTWPRYARLTQGSCLSIKETEFIEAARASGESTTRVILRHILPNALPQILVMMTLDIGRTILQASSISFIGLGVQPPTPEWGIMAAEGRNYILNAWWIPTFPGFFVFLLALSFNLLGDALRDALDPRLRYR